MVTQRSARPLSSFLLRVTEWRAERIDLRYEMLELRSGRLHRFASLAALVRFIAARQHGVLPAPKSIPARSPLPRRKKRK